MKKYTLYETTTGKIKWHTYGDSVQDVMSKFDDCDGAIEGHVDGNQFEIINGVAIERSTYSTEQLEKAWTLLRAERDRRLTECDWTQIPDSPANSSTWAIYRQALRDLPSNTVDPNNPTWPVPPSS